MKHWSLENSWEEIIERLEELESFELPFNIVSIKTLNGKVQDISEWKDNLVYFEFTISKFPCIRIYFANSNFFHEKNLIVSCRASDFKSKKESIIYCLNIWEKYMFDKKYLKDKIEFDNWCEKILKR